MPTKLIKCNCSSDYQDSKYGKFNRVANQTRKQERTVYRCTVCGRETT